MCARIRHLCMHSARASGPRLAVVRFGLPRVFYGALF